MIGNGYVPGSRRPRAGPGPLRLPACVRSSSGGCDGDVEAQQARPRRGRRPPRAQPGSQGGPADRQARPAAHHRLGRAGHAAAGRARRRRPATGTPWVNRLLDAVRADVGLEHGVALPVWDALLRGEAEDLLTLAQKAAAGSVRFRLPEGRARDPGAAGGTQAGRRRRTPNRRPPSGAGADDRAGSATLRAKPWIYLIVATGDIHEDIPQAQTGRPRGRRRDRGDPLHRVSRCSTTSPRAPPGRASPAPTPPRRTSG